MTAEDGEELKDVVRQLLHMMVLQQQLTFMMQVPIQLHYLVWEPI